MTAVDFIKKRLSHCYRDGMSETDAQHWLQVNGFWYEYTIAAKAWRRKAA